MADIAANAFLDRPAPRARRHFQKVGVKRRPLELSIPRSITSEMAVDTTFFRFNTQEEKV